MNLAASELPSGSVFLKVNIPGPELDLNVSLFSSILFPHSFFFFFFSLIKLSELFYVNTCIDLATCFINFFSHHAFLTINSFHVGAVSVLPE